MQEFELNYIIFSISCSGNDNCVSACPRWFPQNWVTS